jgi:tRNA threonylcarbamoyladenosine biosynthesis protein TsaB
MPAPVILALDTATDVCSVALLRDGALSVEREVVGQRHSSRALPMVDAVLAACGVRLAEVDAIAFGAGPGSFTGLRIACGLAQGLAWGGERRVIAVGNLAAMAARVFSRHPEVERVLCAIDARMREAYAAVYGRAAEPRELVAPRLAASSELATLAAGAGAIAGDALAAFPDAWSGAPASLRLPAERADAGDIAWLAAQPGFQAAAVAPALAAPLYVRDRVALTSAERAALR